MIIIYKQKQMSQIQLSQEIQVTGSLVSFNIFQQKLMRNFYIINSRLKKLDQIHELDIKIKALEKEQKFINSKVETMAEKLPKENPISRIQVKTIVKDQIYDILNSKDDRLAKTSFNTELTDEIHKLKVQLARIRVGDYQGEGNSRRQSNLSLHKNASFTAGQALLQDNKKIPKDSLKDCLDKQQYSMVNNMIKGDSESLIEDINAKFQELNQKIEEVRLGKMFNQYGEKDLEKFEKYEHYELKSQQTARKMKQKPMRLDGIRKQNVRGEILKNDLYSQYQKAELLKVQMGKQGDSQRKILPSMKGAQTLTNFKDDSRLQPRGVQFADQKQRLKPSKSLRKLDRIERKLKVDDIKQLNSVLREIQLRIEGRVSHEIFIGFVEDIEQKIEILRITKDSTNQLSQLRKMIYSLDNRLQSVVAFLQNSMSDDDALLVKKQWTCVSCDKNVDKYNGKVGHHLNWDSMNSKKLSPTKAGAFGQTGQLANKIRTLMQNQKGAQ